MYVYGVYTSANIEGSGCVSFKIKESRIQRLGANNLQIGKSYNFVVNTRKYDNGNTESVVEDIYTK